MFILDFIKDKHVIEIKKNTSPSLCFIKIEKVEISANLFQYLYNNKLNNM
jgi:hypothetical protein